MMASAFAGWIWITFGAAHTFLFAAASAVLISIYFFGFVLEQKQSLHG
jgi:hypothetical protein